MSKIWLLKSCSKNLRDHTQKIQNIKTNQQKTKTTRPIMEELFKEYDGIIPQPLLDKMRESLPEKTKKTDVKKFLEKLKEEYESAQVEAGESVGLVAAESLGEQGTQMTLNTKHFQGVAELNITVGLPRIIEVFDARKTLRTPLMEVYLKGKKWTAESVANFAAQLKETTLEELSDGFEVDLAEATVIVQLNPEALAQRSVRPTTIAKRLEKLLKNLVTKTQDHTLYLKLQKEGTDLNKLFTLKEQAKKLYVSGEKGISQVLPMKKGDEYFIMTAGTSLKKVLKLEEVDATRTKSNDLYEIESLFGIEAVRQLVIEEIMRVVEDQGLNIDLRHIMLVADMMCASGKIKGITRYGVVGEKSSVLARASFETPIRHLINAAVRAEEEPVTIVIENVMINQPIPSGTGMPRLVTTAALGGSSGAAGSAGTVGTTSASGDQSDRKTHKSS